MLFLYGLMLSLLVTLYESSSFSLLTLSVPLSSSLMILSGSLSSSFGLDVKNSIVDDDVFVDVVWITSLMIDFLFVVFDDVFVVDDDVSLGVLIVSPISLVSYISVIITSLPI